MTTSETASRPDHERWDSGAEAPALGARARTGGPGGRPRFFVCPLFLGWPLFLGCTAELESRTLEPVQVAIASSMQPTFDDGELVYYEVKREIQFPIFPPTEADLAELGQTNVAPFGREPWFEPADLSVQLTWTVSNLDAETHAVRLLVDPWNEFGRYWPGLTLVDVENGEVAPNRSGIELFFEVPGTSAVESSRRHGTATFDDMEELAIDFATAINVIENPPDPIDPTTEAGDNLTVQLVNHAFHVQNRSHKDPLVAPYKPERIPGLTGVDVGLRMEERGDVALEVVVELVGRGRDLLIDEDGTEAPLPVPSRYFTVGNAQ